MRGSMRRRGEAWELRVYLGRDPITGKPRYRSRTFRGSKRRAEEALARLLTESRSGAEVPTGQTFGGLVEQWFTSWSGEWSPSTMAETRRMIDTKLVGLAKVKLERLTPAYLDTFYGELRLRGGTTGGPLAQSTVRRIHAVVSSALEQAVRWGWLDNNPAQRAWKGKGKGANRPAPNSVPATTEVVRLLDAAWASGAWNLAALLELEVHTGLRRSELLALRWPSFDVAQGTLSVGSAIVRSSDGLVEKPATKTNSTRVVLLSTDAQEILRGHRERCVDRAAATGVGLAPDCYIFSTSADGTKAWWPSSASRSLRLLQERAGLDPIGLQELRRFHSSLLVLGGVDMATESERLGHGPTVALRSYARSNREAHARAAAVVADALTAVRTSR